MKKSDVKIRSVETFRVHTVCRTPLKFGAVVVDEVPIGYAKVTVENRAGKVATGWGAMFLMDLWAWPVSKAPHEAKNRVMCEIFDAYGKLLSHFKEFSHPRAPDPGRRDTLPGRPGFCKSTRSRHPRCFWECERH
jgi:hypothetical protein